MRFRFRKPSLRKRIAARTSLKRLVRHSLGIKVPRGWGWLTNPKRAAYNRLYQRTTFGIDDLVPGGRGSGRARGGSAFAATWSGCLVLTLALVCLCCGGPLLFVPFAGPTASPSPPSQSDTSTPFPPIQPSSPLPAEAPMAEMPDARTPATPADPATKVIMGQVVGISDGDTLTVRDESRVQYRIRLQGIDAPEYNQSFGTQAKKALSDAVLGKQVRVEWNDIDQHGRTLGHVYLDDRWINKELVENGWAWHFRYYSQDQRLAQAEEIARERRHGLWAGKTPIPPWEFRSRPGDNRKGASRQPVRSSRATD